MNVMRDDSGFTLVELLVTAIILVFLFSVVFAVMQSGIRSWQRGEAQVDRQQNVRIMMDRLVREVRQAERLINVSEDGRSVKFKDYQGRNIRYAFDIDAGQIVRQVLDENGVPTGNNIVGYGITAVNYAVYQENTALSVSVTSGRYTADSYVFIRAAGF